MNNDVRSGEVRYPLRRIVSGGQTGVDRAALDVAIELGLEVGGWCPAGRRAEDGRVPERYPLKETPTAEYAQRTAWNVRDSDATLILGRGDLSGGTLTTLEEARRRGKPVLVADLRTFDTDAVRKWLDEGAMAVLNVAGPRASEEDRIYDDAQTALYNVLSES